MQATVEITTTMCLNVVEVAQVPGVTHGVAHILRHLTTESGGGAGTS